MNYNQEMEGKNSQTDQVDNFKPLFKKYKRRDKPLDLSDVVGLEKLTDSSGCSAERVEPIIPRLTPVVGLKPVQDWSIFHFPQHAGFYLIENPFLPGSQRYWSSRCLQDLPRPPHVTNLTVHPDLHPDTLWNSFVTEFRHRGPEAYNSSSPLRKLRWTTIGYHYHWDTKEYKEEDYTPFPEDIGVLAHYVARVLGFPEFQAEAGIVNYYHHDSSLAAHTDHSELDHDAPLLSISFGQDAIFLMGGLTKEQTPTAVRLHSGDICVMSGDARLAYHAVPRILPSPFSTPPACFDMSSDDWKGVDSWGVGDTPGCVGDTPACVGDTPACVGDTPACVGDTPACVGDTPACVRDAPACVGDAPGCKRDAADSTKDPASGVSDKPTSSAGDDSTVSGSHTNLPTHTGIVSSQKRDSHTSSSDSLCHVYTAARCVDSSAESNALPSAVKDTKGPSAQCAGHSSPEKAFSAASHGGLFHTTSSSHHAASVSAENHSHTADKCNSDSLSRSLQQRNNIPQVYEEKVKGVNHRLVSTLKNLDWQPFAAYLSSSRLNVNIRQVLKAGQSFSTASSGDSPPVLLKKPRTEI